MELVGEYDEFHVRKKLSGHQLQEYQGELADDACNFLREVTIAEFGFDPGKQNVIDAANLLCLDNRHHPIRDYLDDQEWDGVRRINSWLIDYMGAEDTELKWNVSLGASTSLKRTCSSQ
jgi:predicted P-loop ATPase